MPARIVVVCGYGCNLDSPLRPYLDRVADFCLSQVSDTVVLCGGPTQQRSFPGETEARVMYRYLSEKIGQALPDWSRRCTLEEASYTTYDNIEGAARIIKGRHGLGCGTEITIFCEATRALKIAALARHFLGFPPSWGGSAIRIETDSWELMHPQWEVAATIKDFIALYIPLMNRFQRWQRIAKSKTR